MSASHDPAMLDDVAVYALGSLPASDAERVRAHLATCAECRAELQALQPAVTSLAASAEQSPGALLKARVMRTVRADAQAHAQAAPAKKQPSVWPAYFVAAACFAIALVSTLMNLSLVGQLRQAQTKVAQIDRNSTGLARSLAQERATLADIMDDSARRFPVNGGEVIRVRDKLYITLHDVPAPPRGKVYQAWTLAKGAKLMSPSLTFVPDRHGVAVISLPVDARQTAAVAVSVEPDGGSKQPTSTPTFVVSTG